MSAVYRWEVLIVIITESDLMMDDNGQPVVSVAGESLMVSGIDCFLQDVRRDDGRGMFLGCGLWLVYAGLYPAGAG